MMKARYFRKGILILLLISILLLPGCGNKTVETAVEQPEDGTLCIATSFYPIYALTAMIAGDADNVEVTCIAQPSDECLRSYALSDWDAALIAASSAIVIDGAGLENYSSALYKMGDTGPAVITADYDQTLLTHENILNTDEASEHYKEGSPFIYMCTDGADEMLSAIAAGMMILDPDSAEVYSGNLEKAHETVKTLRSDIELIGERVAGESVIVMNEAFIYTCKEFGLSIEAEYARESGDCFSGSQSEECVSALTACESRVVLIEKQAPASLVKTLEDAGFTVVKLSTMSEIPASRGADGWAEIIRSNASEILKGIANDETC